MSWEIANCCAKRKFGSPVRKLIIMFLADKASDDGSGIWCSKGTIQRHTELGETTVKRAMNEFLKEGIIVETGKRRCANVYTVVYRIQVDRVNELECIYQNEKRPEFSTGSAEDGVLQEPGTGATQDGVRGPERNPNHPKTIQKPPSGARAREDGFDQLWNEWPSAERPKKRQAAKCVFDRLSPADKKHSVQYAEAFRCLQNRQGEFALMIPFLKNRSFRQLADGPEINCEGKFIITPSRPEWEAWTAYTNLRGSVEQIAQFERSKKFVAPQRWPPKIESEQLEAAS